MSHHCSPQNHDLKTCNYVSGVGFIVGLMFFVCLVCFLFCFPFMYFFHVIEDKCLFTGNITKATFIEWVELSISLRILLSGDLTPWIFGLKTIKLQITSTKKELFQHCNSSWSETVENPNCLKLIYRKTGTLPMYFEHMLLYPFQSFYVLPM